MNERRQRIEAALWGLFAGDALAMPAHWFYGRDRLREAFDGGIRDYAAAPHPHPESFMVGMEYHPDVERARAAGRDYDILHGHARFYDTSFSELEMDTGERESEHGNATPALEDRYHYHHGLGAGENTNAAVLARVLMRSVVAHGRYDEEAFLDDFVAFMTGEEKRDPYLEIYLRMWFERYAEGRDRRDCAATQREVWSIGSMGGMIRPLVLSMLGGDSYLGLGMAIGHQWLTHRSENVAAALGVAVPMLSRLLAGEPAREALAACGRGLRVPEVTGEEMHRLYREHEGPGNIPEREMWELHTRLAGEAFDAADWAARFDEDEVILERLATACYPEHGLPLSLFLACKHDFEPRAALLANANAGGDNVHRGALLGILAGAAAGELPAELCQGLADHDELAGEIGAFAEVAAGGADW